MSETVFHQARSHNRRRILIDLISLLLGAVLLISIHLADENDLVPVGFGRMWFGLGEAGRFPFTIQAMCWLAFFLGIAELYQQVLNARNERAYLESDPIKSRPNAFLKPDELKRLYFEITNNNLNTVLSQVILRVITSYQGSKSREQSGGILSSTLDLFSHELELRYSFVRYLLWAIPSLGFVGTVLGISNGLQIIAENPMSTEVAQIVMGDVVGALAVAFDTTLVALVLTTILAFLTFLVEGRHERTLNDIGQYSIDNLINRLQP